MSGPMRKAWRDVQNGRLTRRVGFKTPLRRDAVAAVGGGALAIGALAANAPVAAVLGAAVLSAAVFDAFAHGVAVRKRR